MIVTKAQLYPVSPLDGLNNYKRVQRIEQDGSIIERVYLDIIDPSMRELLIFQHYLSFMVKHFESDEVGIKINSRDEPWDFNISLSTGREFNIEITAIADNMKHFTNDKSEERLSKWRQQQFIPYFELQKLGLLFPNSEIYSYLKKLKSSGIGKKQAVKNPLYRKGKNIIVSNVPAPLKSLSEILNEVINKKLKKKHAGKEKTVLLIDNRTGAFDLPELQNSVEEISDDLDKTPFMEIWVYTGYASDFDGNNAEYSFTPIKCSQNQFHVLDKLSLKSEDGLYI
ncbi:hypothetical protein [Psychromonas aquatilis]|uniref:Uncharacterized protein n=1 Tax=Psychromonas aquatilis TaxID=2005072 RepID=A0ABU9GSR5_9GAMM